MQQIKCPNVYLAPPGNYRSFRTTDGLVICRRCNQVEYFARACPGNLPPPKAPLRYQNHQHSYVHPGPSQRPQLLYTPHSTPHPPPAAHNQYSQHPSHISHIDQHDTMGYPYPRNVACTNPSQRPPFSSAGQTNNKYLLEHLTF